MTAKIAILDYGMGNLQSVINGFVRAGAGAKRVSDSNALGGYDAYVLPGVGAFGTAMERLNSEGFIKPLEREILANGKPILGICLGMQLMAKTSEEYGRHCGLGWLDGHVTALPGNTHHRVPHVGWVDVDPVHKDWFPGGENREAFYFDHSFYLKADSADILGKSAHAISFPAAVRQGSIIATQFHPEKSQRAGIRFLKNFLKKFELA